MTLIEWLAILALASIIVFVTNRTDKHANRREPEPPDRGGLPCDCMHKSQPEDWVVSITPVSEIECSIRDQYPLGMHYAPDEPIVPKRRKPRLGGKGLHRLLIGVGNREQYIFVFPVDTKPSDVLLAAQEWSENPGLSFDGHCEDGVLDLLIQRDSMME